MSEGLKTLLEAAQFIEQQEKLKLSPPILHSPQRFIVQYDATTTTVPNGLLSSSSLSTTNNNSINIRNSNIRHGGGSGSGSISGTLQVSSSAPAAAATFQHVNGHQSSSVTHPHVTATVLTNGTNSATTNGHHHPPQQQQQQQQHNSQLIHANHHDYEFNGNSGGGAGVTATSSVATGLTNGISVTTPSSPSVAAAAAITSLLSSLSHMSSESRIAANHQMHVQNSNGNSSSSSTTTTTSSSMMVDDIPPTQQHSTGYATASGISNGQQHSPPRQSGNHYMHMISQQAGAAGGNPHVTHVTPRRRTISSTSNGAGTREVHNKLEKNRRAHLKECYDALKNELSLKDEDRRKTSNLAILGEGLKCVKNYQKRNQELEAEWEHLANEKINLQKRILTLKRDLGPKYEQTFLGIFPDIEIGSIPSERDTTNDTHSLSSGRGSVLYSSSSSLSSGGSNGSNSNGSSNAISSPVGAGLQTAMPTAITPVINKISNNINNNTNISNSSTSPIAINSNNIVMQQQQLQHQRKHPTTTITTTIQAVTIPTQVAGTGLTTSAPILGGGNNSPTAVSPTALVTFGGSVASSMPLSLTAKNISATAITRGSPTPSTPSPSPSSSSGVSSSSSLISSSPPINGVINNGRNVTVNIPNGLKLQAANANGVTVGIGGGTLSTAHTLTGTIGNGAASAAATIIATSAPAQGANNTNNAAVLAANHMTQSPQQQQQYNGRKKGLNSSSHNNHVVVENVLSSKSHHQFLLQQSQISHEDGEQPAKFLKVFNATATLNGSVVGGLQECLSNGGQKIILTNSNVKTAEEAPGVGISISNSNLTQTNGKSLTNGCSSSVGTNELCRLPGGAELNILPTINSNSSNINTYSTITTTTSTANGLKSDDSSTSTMATAFYHANGKITFVSGPAPSPITNAVSNGTRVTAAANGILLKDVTSSVAPLLVSATGSPVATCTSTSSSVNSINDLHFTGNFAQLLAAANGNCNAVTTHPSSSHSTGVTSNGYAAAMSKGSVNVASLSLTSNLPHVTTTVVDMAKTKTNSKSSSIVAWRSGATTTIN